MKDSPMNEKLSLQFMADALSQRGGVPKKVAESFIRAFFDTIVESVKDGEDFVRIDGFGSFKRVAVDSRESVNVSNGERIVIAGYNKLSFSPDDSVVEMLRARHDVAESVAEAEAESEPKPELEVAAESEVDTESVSDDSEGDFPDVVSEEDSSAEPLSIDDLIEVEEPVCVECAADEFSGIDLLISTPESVDDVRHQLDAATAKVAEAIDMAKKASAEKARLERLLDRLESNVKPESDEERLGTNAASGDEPICMLASPVGAVEGSSIEDGALECADSECKTSCEDAFARVTAGGNAGALGRRCGDSCAADGESHERGVRRRWWLVGVAACAVVVLLSCIVYFVYGTFTSIEKVEEVAVMKKKDVSEQHKKDNTKDEMASKKEETMTDSLSRAEQNKTVGFSGSGGEAAKDDNPFASAKPDKPLAAAKDEPSAKRDEPAKAKASRPTTYVVKKGETLTRIAMRVYGTKDSVKAIIRLNTLVNPNNVPAGAKIKLP